MGRLAVIGDIGGHLTQLSEALLVLGVDLDAATLPADLVVIQVGDLVHRGPDSAGVVALVDTLLTNNPQQWVQLLGNHEACHLAAPLFPHDSLDDATVETLRRWHRDGTLRLGVALETELGPMLVTHAGLTHELWVELDRPVDPRTAVLRLAERPKRAWRPGRMLADSSGPGGVLWAEAGPELYASWLRAEHHTVAAPFGQIHGHSSAYRWASGRSTAPPEVAERLRVDEARRHVHLTLAGNPMIGLDPGFGTYADGRWAPLVLEGHLD